VTLAPLQRLGKTSSALGGGLPVIAGRHTSINSAHKNQLALGNSVSKAAFKPVIACLSSEVSCSTATAAESKRQGSQPPKEASAQAGKEVESCQGYSAALLVGVDGQELSFEEVRARAWQTRQQSTAQARDKQPLAAQDGSLDDEVCSPAVACAAQPSPSGGGGVNGDAYAHQAQAGCRDVLSVQRASPQDQSTASTVITVPEPHARAPPQSAPSPAHLRTMPVDGPASPWAPAASSAPLAEPTMTMSMRAALDAVNDMFCDDLTTGVLPCMMAPDDECDPTVTVNTRAALDAVNQMFLANGDTSNVRGWRPDAKVRCHGLQCLGAVLSIPCILHTMLHIKVPSSMIMPTSKE